MAEHLEDVRFAVSPQLRQFWITRFDFLDGALPGGVNPSDIDQVLERNRHFLYIECKRPHQPVPRGQQILFDHLVDAPPQSVRLLQVVGDPPDDIRQFGWWGKPLASTTLDEVRALVRRWWDWAGRA